MTDYLTIAVQEARYAYERGQYPIAAVLTIDGKMSCFEHNRNNENGDWKSHAEASIIHFTSTELKKAAREKKETIIYTSLEPCLMCLGMATIHRISKMVYACPDPLGGATGLVAPTEWYERRIPKLEFLYNRDAAELYLQFLKEVQWPGHAEALEKRIKEMNRPTLFDTT